jgi:hypothetical protein
MAALRVTRAVPPPHAERAILPAGGSPGARPPAPGLTRTATHTAPEAATGRDDFGDSLCAPDGPDAVIDTLQ